MSRRLFTHFGVFFFPFLFLKCLKIVCVVQESVPGTQIWSTATWTRSWSCLFPDTLLAFLQMSKVNKKKNIFETIFFCDAQMVNRLKRKKIRNLDSLLFEDLAAQLWSEKHFAATVWFCLSLQIESLVSNQYQAVLLSWKGLSPLQFPGNLNDLIDVKKIKNKTPFIT